jgi:hypothetical protein
MSDPQGHPGYLALLDELRALHQVKSGGYGTGTDKFANYTAVAAAKGQPRFVYPIDRALEKITRCYSLLEQGRVGELGEEFLDIASTFLCAEAMRRADHREDHE